MYFVWLMRRPPRSTRQAHSYPARRSSDLLTPCDSKPRYVIADENHQWTHILADDGRDTPVLFVFDTLKNRLIDAMIQVEGKSWRWRYATTGELENLTGHLVNANQDALENPEVYGLLLRNSKIGRAHV